MKYTFAAIAALAGIAFAQNPTEGFDVFSAPVEDSVLQAGETYTIMWDPAPAKYDDETIQIILMAGDSQQTLQYADEPIADGIVNSVGAYNWEVPSDLGDDKVYGLRIQLASDEDVFQWSFSFQINPTEDDEEALPSGNSTSSTMPTMTATDEEETEMASTVSVPTTMTTATTATTTTAEESSSASDSESSITVSEAGSAQATAGAFALVGGLAVAALAL